MEQNLIHIFQKEIAQIIREKTDALTSGSIADFATYKGTCGEIRGLTQAVEKLREVAAKLYKKLDDGDDDIRD